MSGPGRGAEATPSRVANALLAVAAVTVFLGAAEIACRVFDLRPRMGGADANPPWLSERWLLPRDDYREAFASEGFLGRYYDLYEWDRFRFYRLRPGAEVSLLDVFAPAAAREATRWSAKTGPEGYRTERFEKRPPPGRRRVVALGDSSTFGWGVADDETYAAQLEATLDGDAKADTWEVLNLGVPGYSTFQGTVMLAREALPLAPDVVTWSYLSNDGAMTGEADRATYAQRSGWLGALLEVLHHSRFYETLEAWIGKLRSGAKPEKGVRNVSGWGEAEANVRGAVAAARAAGVPLVLVANCVRGPAAEVMARVARDTGTPYLDATKLVEDALPRIGSDPAFEADRAKVVARYGERAVAGNPRLLGFLPDLCHPNPVGHRLIAQALAPLVEAAAASRAPTGGERP